MKDENLDYCKHIRSELEKYYNGEVYKCPDCDELIHIPDTDELKETDEGFVLPCGCTIEDLNDLEQMSLYDYFDEVFDTIYYVGSDKEVRGVRLMVAYGGPNVYIDTFRKTVELYWWNEHATVDLYSDVCEEITEQFAQVYTC